MNINLKRIAAAFLCLIPSIAFAAPPVNDNIANAIVVTADSTTSTVNNTDATNEASDPADSGYRTTWWLYRPQAN